MIEESLLKSNFVGRDGFRWWIGQIPPIESQGGQANGEGWGNRSKVRIMGYHPQSETDLSNDDLPWAQVLLPTTAGTGAGNRSTNTKLHPGDVVFGFFMDGDNAQIPVIIGCFGRTSEVSDEPYESPFQPFTGYTDRIKNDGSKVKADQSNEQTSSSQKSPRSLPPDQIQKLNQSKEKQLGEGSGDELSYFNAIGNNVVSANACNSTLAQSIMSEVENLIGRLKIPSAVTDAVSEINRTVDKVQAISNGFVGQMFNNLYTELIPILQNGLDLLYKKIFAAVYAATPGDASIKFAAAHAAGVQAQTALVFPTKILEDAISCVAAKVVNSLFDLIEDLINSLLGNVENYKECVGTQFTAGLLNGIISEIIEGLSSALSGVTSIISPGFSLDNLLRGSVKTILGAGGGILDCNQNSKKCSGQVGDFSVGCGNQDSAGDDIYQDILDTMNVGKEVGNAVQYSDELPDDVFETLQNASIPTKLLSNFGSNDSVLSLQDVSLVQPGQVISVGTETMTIINVDVANNIVQVDRPNPTKSFSEGTELKILGNVSSELYGSFQQPIDIETIAGSFDIFNNKTKNPNRSSETGGCYTGEPISCNPPTATVFGGGGNGGKITPLFGNYKLSKDGSISGSIIGAEVVNSGSGYRYPPYVKFSDNCNRGYGAVARTVINDSGRITDAYIISPGENYPVAEVYEYEIVYVVIEDGGREYSSDSKVIDNLGNEYELVIDDGVIVEVNPININELTDLPSLDIISQTGSGAILRPILQVVPFALSELPELINEPTSEIPVIGVTTIGSIVPPTVLVTSPTLIQPESVPPISPAPPSMEEELPPLDPSILRVRESARLRRELSLKDLKKVKDCPN